MVSDLSFAKYRAVLTLSESFQGLANILQSRTFQKHLHLRFQPSTLKILAWFAHVTRLSSTVEVNLRDSFGS